MLCCALLCSACLRGLAGEVHRLDMAYLRALLPDEVPLSVLRLSVDKLRAAGLYVSSQLKACNHQVLVNSGLTLAVSRVLKPFTGTYA